MDYSQFPHYRSTPDVIPIDVEKLRPQNSYGHLFENRSHFLHQIQDSSGDIDVEKLEYVPCPLCDCDSSQLVTKKDGFSLVSCGSCSLIFVNPRLKISEYRTLYSGRNYGHIVSKLALASHDYRKERFGSERLSILEKYHFESLPKNLLDVGSGSGFFIEKAKEHGWNALGIELSPDAVDFSRHRDNQVYDQTLLEIDLPSESFSAISMFDVLEHLPNPKEHLIEVHRILSRSGIIFLYVPNWNSASRLLLGNDAHFIWPTHHLIYFTPETIEILLTSLGFSVEMITTEGLDIEDWIWQQEKRGLDTTLVSANSDTLQFLSNAGGWGKNLRVIARKD